MALIPCKEIEEVERGESSVVEKRITSVNHSVADTSVFIAAVSAKEEEVRLENGATSRCNRPDGYNRLVERDDASGAKSFFNSGSSHMPCSPELWGRSVLLGALLALLPPTRQLTVLFFSLIVSEATSSVIPLDDGLQSAKCMQHL